MIEVGILWCVVAIIAIHIAAWKMANGEEIG